MQCYLPLLSAVAAAAAATTDQSKLPKYNSGRSLCKVVGHNGPDQLNNDKCHRVGRGTTWTA